MTSCTVPGETSLRLVLLFNFQPLINNLAQLTIDLVLIVAVTARAYDARKVANETLVFFRPLNYPSMVWDSGFVIHNFE